MLSADTEILVRNLITTKAAVAAEVAFGIAEPVYFAGREDFAAQISVIDPSKTDEENKTAFEALLCNFVMTSFGRFDYADRGTLYCPVMFLTYDILIFQEFRKGLEKDTAAFNIHARSVLDVWEAFRTGHVLREEPLIRHQRLEQIGRTVKNQNSEHLPGVRGFYTILQIRVEVA